MSTLKIIFLLAFYMFSITKSLAQIQKEVWKGELVVDVNGTETLLLFSIEIVKTNGDDKCYGENTLWVDVNKKSYYAKSSFEGTYNAEGLLEFHDTAIIESTSPKSPYFFWCEKKGKLYTDENKMTGEILSESPKGNCSPAWARLEKVE